MLKLPIASNGQRRAALLGVSWNSKLQCQATVLLRCRHSAEHAGCKSAAPLQWVPSVGWLCNACNDKKRVNKAEVPQSAASTYQAANNKMCKARHSSDLDLLQWQAIIEDRCTATLVHGEQSSEEPC